MSDSPNPYRDNLTAADSCGWVKIRDQYVKLSAIIGIKTDKIYYSAIDQAEYFVNVLLITGDKVHSEKFASAADANALLDDFKKKLRIAM